MHRKHLLTSVQMARFVAYGSHRIDGVVEAQAGPVRRAEVEALVVEREVLVEAGAVRRDPRDAPPHALLVRVDLVERRARGEHEGHVVVREVPLPLS